MKKTDGPVPNAAAYSASTRDDVSTVADREEEAFTQLEKEFD